MVPKIIASLSLTTMMVMVMVMSAQAMDPMYALNIFGLNYCGSNNLRSYSTGAETTPGNDCVCSNTNGQYTWCGYSDLCTTYYYKVKGPIYFDIQVIPGTPFIFSEYFDNNSTSAQTTTFTKTQSFTNSYSWTNEQTMDIGESMSVTAGLPGILSVTDDFSFSLDLSSSETQTGTDVSQFSVQQEIQIPPMNTTKVEFAIAQSTYSGYYKAEVIFDQRGTGEIWCSDTVNDHYCWFIPTAMYLNGTFEGTYCMEGRCFLFGKFSGVQGVSSSVKVSECPLGDHC